jgi:hypothetical protein
VQKAEKVYTVTGKRDAEILIDCTYWKSTYMAIYQQQSSSSEHV